jgi:multiple sugar transport system substrate-binding protein
MNIPGRKAIAGAVTLLLAGALVALSASAATARNTRHASQTITVWTMEDTKAFSQLMQTFTKQTGINVDVQGIPWGNVNDKLTTAVASGNGPDVVQIGISFLPSFVNAGALLDLHPYLAKNPTLRSSNFLSGVAAARMNPKGKVLTLPWVSDVRILFYRTDIFAQTGISGPPKTWAQLLADAQKLAARGNGQYGFYIPQWDSALPVELTWQAGGNVTANGKVSFNSEAFRTAANFYVSLYKAKVVPTASDFDQTQGFVSGVAPMLISGPYLAGAINGAAPNLKGKWKVALLPRDKTNTSLLAGSNIGIWHNSQHVDAALKLLDYLAKPATQVAWFKLVGELPTSKAALANPSLKNDPLVKVYAQQLQHAQLLPLTPAWDKIGSDLLNALNSIVLTGADEGSALQQLNQNVATAQN